jgi:hypothetical protein
VPIILPPVGISAAVPRPIWHAVGPIPSIIATIGIGRAIIAIDGWRRRIAIDGNGVAISGVGISRIAVAAVAVAVAAIAVATVAAVTIVSARPDGIACDGPDNSANDDGSDIIVIAMVVAIAMIMVGKRGAGSKA